MNRQKLKTVLSFLIIFFVGTSTVFAQVWVDGYYRDDGTYVKGHQRTNPDGNPYNNYSFPGNYNPNTGKITKGNPNTYLKNYYDLDIRSNFDLPDPNIPDNSFSTENNLNFELKPDETAINSNKKANLKEDISFFQSCLKIAGYNPGPIDGIMGSNTQEAIEEFQLDNGIKISGNLDWETVNTLALKLRDIYSDDNQMILSLSGYKWLKGTWIGIGYQYNNDSSWKMEVSFTSEGYFIKYYSPNCSGEWRLQKVNGSKLIFKETINKGINECVNNGYVIIDRFSKETINFKYLLPNTKELGAQAYLSKK